MTKKDQTNKDETAKRVPKQVKDAPPIGTPSDQGEIAHSKQTVLAKHHMEFAEFQEGYISKYIQLADTKATWIFALLSALIIYMITDSELTKLYMLMKGDHVASLMVIGVLGLLIAGAFLSFLVIAPNLSSKSGESIVFFGAVAKRPNIRSYLDDVASLNEAQLAHVRLQHCYDLSRVCAAKYRRLAWSIRLGALGALALMAVVLLLTI